MNFWFSKRKLKRRLLILKLKKSDGLFKCDCLMCFIDSTFVLELGGRHEAIWLCDKHFRQLCDLIETEKTNKKETEESNGKKRKN